MDIIEIKHNATHLHLHLHTAHVMGTHSIDYSTVCVARRVWWIINRTAEMCTCDIIKLTLHVTSICTDTPAFFKHQQQQAGAREKGRDAHVWRSWGREDQHLLCHPRRAHVLHVQGVRGTQRLRGGAHLQHLPDKEGEVWNAHAGHEILTMLSSRYCQCMFL